MLDWGVHGVMKLIWTCSWFLVPVWLLLTWWSHKKRRLQGNLFGDQKLVYATVKSAIWKSKQDHIRARSGDPGQALRLIRGSVRRRENLRIFLITIALFAVAIALGRPQWGLRQEEIHQQGIDIVLCVDTSESMKAQDVAPGRLDKARSEIATLLTQLDGNRVGLVGFATTTRLHCPLTLDFRGLRSILDHSLSYGPGTDVEAAVVACKRILEGSDARTRAIVMISDGEDHGGDIDNAIDIARESGIRVFTLGVGTPEGGPIPLGKAENDGYKKKNGELVWTRLEEETMERLARETGGKYFPTTATETEAILLAQEIDKLEKSEFSQTMTTHREDHFGIFLLIAVLMIALEIAIESIGSITWEDADEIAR
ncbi:VWA domain-containing protein [bacterium]|nr:VWA domain-containing protein [bacterium]